MNNSLNLYPHNLEGYDEVKKAYQEGKKLSVKFGQQELGKVILTYNLL